MPAQLAAAVRPVLTGWLADPSVLGSGGIAIGSQAREGGWQGWGGGKHQGRNGRMRRQVFVRLPCHLED